MDVRYAEVTHAVRDSELDGLEVKQGQAMAIVDGRLVAAADDILGAFGGVLEEFDRGGAEYVTVLTALNGSGTTREQLEELAARVAPDAEVSFHEGGQPLVPDPRERRMNSVDHAPQERPTDDETLLTTREHGHRPRLHLRPAGRLAGSAGPLHGAAQGPLRRPDVPRRRRHDLQGVLRQARAVGRPADHVAAHRRRVRRRLRGGAEARTSTSSPCTSPAR